MRRISFRSERGQTAGEYMGVLLLVAVVIGALIYADVDGKIARAANDMVALIAGGEEERGGGSDPGGGNNPGGGGNNPGGGGNGGTGGTGGTGGGGTGGTGGGGNGGGGESADEETDRTIICLDSTKEAGACLQAAGAPNALRETVHDEARKRVRRTMRNLRNSSARPGSSEYRRLVAARNRAVRDLVDSRRITNNVLLKPLSNLRKVVDPRFKDIQAGFTAFGRKAQAANARTSRTAAPNRSSGGPAKKPPATRFLNGLGKVGKGLGIAGTALSLYDNVKKDGPAKGIVKTAGGVGGAAVGAAGVGIVCGAIGVATAGVGGLACAGAAFGASYLGGKYGSDLAGWTYDRGEDLVNFTNDKVIKPVAKATETAVNTVHDVGEEAVEGGKKVLGALNPF